MENFLQTLLTEKGLNEPPYVLIAAAECSPLSKTGGLADVVGALPKALQAMGFRASVITPYHRVIKEKYGDRVEHICHFFVDLGWRHQYAGLERIVLDGVTIYLIDSEYYFGNKIYMGGEAEGDQYCFFQKAVLEALNHMDEMPQVLHCNDWHTSLLPFLIKTQYLYDIRTVLTIHNIAFQGKFGFDYVSDRMGIDSSWYNSEALEHYGCANFLKSGIKFADYVTTVSPGYAEEIKTPQFGEGLDQVLISRQDKLCGIINGLDVGFFDPENDPMIPAHYNAENYYEGKNANKRALLEELGMNSDDSRPLIAMVTRMTSQKGFDLVVEAFDRIMEMDVNFVLLGSGDPAYEEAMREAASQYSGHVCAWIGYNEALAHRIYAGADFLLMPSAFEPCGLSQLIAMRYGTLPIVHEVGGLKDTVQPYNQYTDEGAGFSFGEFSCGSMLGAIAYALNIWNDNAVRHMLIKRDMQGDYSFALPSMDYARLFVDVLPNGAISATHDQYSDDFRSPLGAVRCGESVKLTLKCDTAFSSCTLTANGRTHTMERTDDGFEIFWSAPEEPGVYYYSFSVDGSPEINEKDGDPFRITVYDPDFVTPDWAKGAVMYQIFPDRFRLGGGSFKKGIEHHRAMGRTVEVHKALDEQPKWQGGEKYDPNDYYGGTLYGIETALKELKELGVDVIYLNPIFEAASNHRYNTADYRTIDPMLGTLRSFTKLCNSAKAMGIKIILDGVFSHTGDDSIYFDRYGRYGTDGAYQSKESPYYSWFDFRSWPKDYRCWWNFLTLPEVNEEDPEWQNEVISGEDSVVKKWLRAGASGYRLDVADELPDDVIELIRENIKAENSDSLLLGEVWEDATTKVSYNKRRTYALGKGLDTVMNYPLRTAIINFALGKATAGELCKLLIAQRMHYPEPMYHCLMNHLGSHDTARLRTVLGAETEGHELTRQQQAEVVLTPEQNRIGLLRQRLCAGLQFTLPGMPCIYYGDEEGMQGMRDPFNRGMFRHMEDSTRAEYARLAAQRRSSDALRLGGAAFCAPDDDTICFLRASHDETLLVVASRVDGAREITLDFSKFVGFAKPYPVLPAEPVTVKLNAMECKVIKL